MKKNDIKYPNLLAEMGRKGETQTSIAKLLGVSIPTICRKISGRVDWNISEVETLCEYFDKDYYQLFIKRK